MNAELAVLFEDNHLLVVAKPAGQPTVPDESGDTSLLEQAKAWIGARHAKPGAVWLGVVQRLDRPVSGALVFARTSKAAARLSLQLRERRMEKVYWGVSRGRPPESGGRVEQWLVKDEERRVVRAVAAPAPGVEAEAGARLAMTSWRLLALEPDPHGPRALLELRPETGRAHQLRLAAASLGCALLGDLKYGAEAPLPDRSVALHARTLAFEHPTRSVELVFEAPPPEQPWWRFRERLDRS